jgi:hypothetical protein
MSNARNLLLAEAERCRRLALEAADEAVRERLLELAEEYILRAAALASARSPDPAAH